jgi:phosphotriesterase-related protein
LAPANDKRIIDSIVAMIKAGHAGQIVLSHDICTQAQLKINGGGGYTYIDDVIIPGLKAQGIDDATIDHITHENPAHALTFVAPQAVKHQS